MISAQMLAFFAKNKKINNSTDRRWSETPHTHGVSRNDRSLLNNNSNENRNKSRRDHDITMAGSYNNREVAKLPTWSDRGDC